MLELASKKIVKLRVGLSAASGFGKTASALRLAKGMVDEIHGENPDNWQKICVIDTENRSASLYAETTLGDGTYIGQFFTIPFEAPYSPELYIEKIKMCENANLDVIIIDSISHEWNGSGGCLDIHTQLGGQFANWATVTPRHNAFIQSILQSKCHIVTTARRKQDYEIVKNERGKNVPQKIGTKEVTRDGFEYELTLNLEILNNNHLCHASKDRTSLFDKKPEFLITEETGKMLIRWANSGVDEVKYCVDSIRAATNRNDLEILWKVNSHLQKNSSVIEAFKEMCIIFPKQ